MVLAILVFAIITAFLCVLSSALLDFSFIVQLVSFPFGFLLFSFMAIPGCYFINENY